MGGVNENRWSAAHPLKPTGTDSGGEPCAYGVDVELPVRSCAEERLDSGQRDDGVVGLMFAVQRQEDLGVHAAEALQFEHLAADRRLAAQHGELESSRATAASARTVSASTTSIASGTCLPITATVSTGTIVLLPGDDSRLLRGDFGDFVAEVLGVVDTDRGDDGHRCVDDVGGVPAPPIPTSTTATSIGASAKAANAIAVTTSNLLIAGPPAASDCLSTNSTNGSISS